MTAGFQIEHWRSEWEKTKADLDTLSFVKKRLNEVEAENLKLRLEQAAGWKYTSGSLLNTERRRLLDEIAGLDEERRALVKEGEAWRQRWHEGVREKAVSENRLGEQTRLLSAAKERQAAAEQGHANAKTEILELRERLGESAQSYLRLEEKLKDTESKNLYLEMQLKDLGKDMGELQQKAAASSVREESLQKDKEDLILALKLSEEQTKVFQDRNAELALLLDRSTGRENELAKENSTQRHKAELLEDSNRQLRLDLHEEILTKPFLEKDPEYVESVVVRSPSTGRRRYLACDEVGIEFPRRPYSPSERWGWNRYDYPRSARARLLRDEVVRSRQLADK